MCVYWIQDCVNIKEFYVYWQAGAESFADYFTKHFSPQYHQTIRPTYILKNNHMNKTDLQHEGVLIYEDSIPGGYQDILSTVAHSHRTQNIFH